MKERESKKAARETDPVRERNRRQLTPDGEPRDDDELSADDLVGESEHSVRVSGGGRLPEPHRSSPRRLEHLSVEPEDLGRRHLEEITEAPADEDEADEDYQAERG
jgi:hypothetical protein